MDALLAEQLNPYLRWWRRFTKEDKRILRMETLLNAERVGLAIPYKDDDGRLAWTVAATEITEQ
jgi:hypothetical protein